MFLAPIRGGAKKFRAMSACKLDGPWLSHLPPATTSPLLSLPFIHHIPHMPLFVNGPRVTHASRRRTIIPGFLYVTFVNFKPKFSVQLGRHVHIR
ncbi:hypothetical protein FA15DRAFT_310085 [Coprinopsis marcescibilis]|uniref:Uncharacterized protein n=1 Tax=Coprinopsis marcescibilis TaxID=230819 RepID=A0A5C3KZZ3_COPMA|nr:hypothetical protein FA15DRAFT_310085 [Coprinopsis marcescibilis]